MLKSLKGNTVFMTSGDYNVWQGDTEGAMLKSQAIFAVTDPGDGSWLKDNVGTNAYGFGALPAGARYLGGEQFGYRGSYAAYWTSSVDRPSNAWYRQFFYSYAQARRGSNPRSSGFGVRCLMD
jgi:uncharacterized protein (TIGR02145 family)